MNNKKEEIECSELFFPMSYKVDLMISILFYLTSKLSSNAFVQLPEKFGNGTKTTLNILNSLKIINYLKSHIENNINFSPCL